jgi:hypothetical protein
MTVKVRIASVKISHVSSILKANAFNHAVATYHTTGREITPATTTTSSRSLDKSEVMFLADAPELSQC